MSAIPGPLNFIQCTDANMNDMGVGGYEILVEYTCFALDAAI